MGLKSKSISKQELEFIRILILIIKLKLCLGTPTKWNKIELIVDRDTSGSPKAFYSHRDVQRKQHDSDISIWSQDLASSVDLHDLSDSILDEELKEELEDELKEDIDNNSDDNLSGILSEHEINPQTPIQPPVPKGKNSYEMMKYSSKKLKESTRNNLKNKEALKMYMELCEEPESQEDSNNKNGTSMIDVYKNFTLNKDEEEKGSTQGIYKAKANANTTKKKNFVRYFNTPHKKDLLKQTQLMQVNSTTQAENILIGDDIEDYLSDELSLDMTLSAIGSPSKEPDELPSNPTKEIAKIKAADILSVFKEKMNIPNLFGWQSEWLSLKDVMKEGASLIYSAPTSAGKSLVSEVIMLKNALAYPKKMVMVMFPFISLINEKEK